MHSTHPSLLFRCKSCAALTFNKISTYFIYIHKFVYIIDTLEAPLADVSRIALHTASTWPQVLPILPNFIMFFVGWQSVARSVYMAPD